MNIFDHLGKIYNEIDTTYANIEVQASSRRHHKKEAEYYSKRQFNKQAYFLFMFTRLEDRVRNLSDQLIDDKVANLTDWKAKRTWDILSKRKDRIAFMDRVALLTEINQSGYNLIDRYYRQRNNIGHGGTFTIAIYIPTFIVDMKRLYRDLNR